MQFILAKWQPQTGQQAAQRLIYYADYSRTPSPLSLLPIPLLSLTLAHHPNGCWAIVQWQIKEKLKASEMKVAQVVSDDEATTQSAQRKIEKNTRKKTLLISALKNCAMSPRRIHLLAA